MMSRLVILNSGLVKGVAGTFLLCIGFIQSFHGDFLISALVMLVGWALIETGWAMMENSKKIAKWLGVDDSDIDIMR